MTQRRSRRVAAVLTQEVESGTAALSPDPDRPNAWTLFLDGVPQSHVDLDDPRHLEFEYVRRLGHVTDLAAPPGAPLRVLHLGGGGCTLARYVAETRPRSPQQVVEIDTALVEFVRARLPLPRTARIRVRSGDARAVLARAPDESFDLIVCDVYSGARSPAHVSSAEFAAEAARALRPGGLYAANVADGSPLAFAKAQAATLLRVFPDVCMIADPAVLRGRRFGNLVLAAGAAAPAGDLVRRAAGDPFPARVLDAAELRRFTGGAAPLTDATARRSPAPPAGTF